MYLAVIILPLLGSIVSGFFGRKVGVNGAQLITSVSVITTTVFAILVFFEVAFNNISVNISLCRWLDLGSINILWAFNFDFLTVSMLIPVLVISSLVHIYSVGYMSSDPHNQRFFSYLSLFTFMMVILVTSNNFLLMFVGWEGVGICSYLLVNFWFTRIAANQSSISALLTNRVGDCFLTIGMFIMLLSFGNLDYTTVFSIAPFVSENNITIIGICLLIGAMAKSSQIGLHVWLPLAMEGPTPVSALIHAATMVTAGVYLLMRASPLLEYTSTVLLACLWIGSITTVFSSVVGLFQQDIKKVIAYSTMSQLGMMVIAIGLSCYNLALFHLVNHAFYKGLLFLAAGAVIHAVADNQDFRKYGGLILFLPLTYTVMLIASLSLVAFPFMTGFYSKDFILESCFSRFNYSSIAVYFTAVIGAMFTTLYSAKVLYLTFIASPNAPAVTYNKAHESDIFMSLPLIILALFSIYFGFLTKDLFIGLGSHAFIDNSIFIHPSHEIYISTEFAVSHFYKLLPFFLTIGTFVGSVFIFEIMPKLIITAKYTRVTYNIFAFLNLKFLIESLYNRFITYFVLNVGGQTTKVLDKGFVEMVGPYGLETFFVFFSRSLNALNTGVVTTYALYILMGFMLYVSLPYLLGDASSLLIAMFTCVFFIFSSYLLVKKSKMKKYINEQKEILPANIGKSNFIVLKSSADTELIKLAAQSLAFCLGFVVIAAATRKIYDVLVEAPEKISLPSETVAASSVKNADTSASIDASVGANVDASISARFETVLAQIGASVDSSISATFDTVLAQIGSIFHNSYSPVKWASDTGDVLISHPYISVTISASIFIILGLGFCHYQYQADLIKMNSCRLDHSYMEKLPEESTMGFYSFIYEILDKHGYLKASHLRWLLPPPHQRNPSHPPFWSGDQEPITSMFDQHIENLVKWGEKVYVFSHVHSYKAIRHLHWPITGDPVADSTVVRGSVSYYVKNFTPFRDWSNGPSGVSPRPGFLEYIATESQNFIPYSELAIYYANYFYSLYHF